MRCKEWEEYEEWEEYKGTAGVGVEWDVKNGRGFMC